VALEKEGATFDRSANWLPAAAASWSIRRRCRRRHLSAVRCRLIHDIPSCEELVSRIMRDAEAIIRSRLEP